MSEMISDDSDRVDVNVADDNDDDDDNDDYDDRDAA
jgi:hypothetical protein